MPEQFKKQKRVEKNLPFPQTTYTCAYTSLFIAQGLKSAAWGEEALMQRSELPSGPFPGLLSGESALCHPPSLRKEDNDSIRSLGGLVFSVW